uniref:Transposase n=1 Tax=Steinernema glaseri TaxID=37863 RepID=A0A1I8ASG5_9BILA
MQGGLWRLTIKLRRPDVKLNPSSGQDAGGGAPEVAELIIA